MHPRVILSVGNFFFSLTTALTAYILIPYLSLFIGEAYAGLVIAVAGVLAVLSFVFLPHLVSHHGAQEIALVAALAEALSLLALAAVPGIPATIIFVIVMLAFQPAISYQFDLLLEATVSETTTIGRVRTLFLTAANLGVCAAPLLLGALLDDTNAYARVFVAGAALLIPFIVLFTARTLPHSAPPPPSRLRDALRTIWHNHDLSGVTLAHFVFYLFGVWAPLYVPAYLHNVIGIPWGTLGWLFALMLVPYVVVEYPAGWLADKVWGDKELLILGFIISGGALATLSILTPSSSLALIATILVLSRVGAALVEGMTEGHFFRGVKNNDAAAMSFFRGVGPIATIVGPVVGSIILALSTYETFFLITGSLVIFGGILTAFLTTDFK